MGYPETQTKEGIITDIAFLRMKSVECHNQLEIDKIFGELEAALDKVGDRGLGLAAIQLGYPKRVSIIKYKGETYKFVNPVVVDTSKVTTKLGEGCLSIPSAGFLVRRHVWIEVTDEINGRKRYEGKLGQAVQHELDHMEGTVLYDINLADPRLIQAQIKKAKQKAGRRKNKGAKKARRKNRK